jgi:glucoamylase
MTKTGEPPGWPGLEPRWTTSAKTGVGTAANQASRVWFTTSHGIVDEVYFPTFDQANTRDFGLLVSDGAAFFSEEKRDCDSVIEGLAVGVPGYRMLNRDRGGRYEIRKIVLTDPAHDALVQNISFEALLGSTGSYHLYALLAPHIANHGAGNNGWRGDYKGITMLFAQRESTTIALACSRPFLRTSCGYSGVSDGWRDVSANKRMTWEYPEARNGNIALTAELDLTGGSTLTLALGFGSNAAEAGQRARAALLRPFEEIVDDYVSGWQAVQSRFMPLDDQVQGQINLFRESTSVLVTHRSKLLAGAMIASLSIPWGSSKGDDDLGGYHLVWPRDLVESAGGLLAAGDAASCRETLTYLMATQEADGHWPQNMWLDGSPYWSGVQMDETAFPILLADQLRRRDELDRLDVWPMVRRAASFVVCNGPVTQQDRWEEDGGYSPFTLAVEIASLLAAADFADNAGDLFASKYLRETADVWNANVERWTYVQDTELCAETGTRGYYVRISPPETADRASPKGGFVPIKNRAPGQNLFECGEIVSPDALALVRFGLRAATDPRIQDTVRVIDHLLKTETSTGPVWHRYDDDGYGEHDDGSPFDGSGVGRGWPLLAGERAHFELAAGNTSEARSLAAVMEAQTSSGGLLPEQVWDAPDIADRELFNGKPSGSARPLVWAHAEYVKLLRSLKDGVVFDVPPQTRARYVAGVNTPTLATWRFNQKCRTIRAGLALRIELPAPAVVHYGLNGWDAPDDARTEDSSLGIYFADLPTARLEPGQVVVFTFLWLADERWEGADYRVTVEED